MNTYNYKNVECISRSTNQCRQIILLGETLLETHIPGNKKNNNKNNSLEEVIIIIIIIIIITVNK